MKLKKIMVSGVVDNIRRVFQILSEQSKKIEHETGLTGPQLWTIKMLDASSPLKVSDLAKRMYLHPATMVGLLDRLEVKGLVTRTKSEKDRRVVYIDLTDQGRELVKSAPEVVQGLLVKGLEQLDTQSLKTTSDGFEHIITILGAQELPPKLILSTDINFPKRRKNGRKAALIEDNLINPDCSDYVTTGGVQLANISGWRGTTV